MSSMVDVIGQVLYEGLEDTLSKEPFDQTEEFNFWDDEDEEPVVRQSQGKTLSSDAWWLDDPNADPAAEGAGDTVSNLGAVVAGEFDQAPPRGDNRWQGKYENGRIPEKALTPIGSGHFLRADAAAAYKAMARDARKAGSPISLNSSYRSYEKQAGLYANRGSNPYPVAAPGQSNHGWATAVDADPSEWLVRNAEKYGFKQLAGDPVHFDYVGGFKAPVNAFKEKRGRRNRPRRAVDRAAGVKAIGEVAKRPSFTSLDVLPGGIAVLELLDPSLPPPPARRKGSGGKPKTETGPKRQMWQAFMDAGRPDLARMVYTPEYDKWIGKESGWVRNITSPPNNQGLANDGYFQVWRGHSYNANGQVAKMTAYQQTRLIARFFPHLEASDIRRYAQEIDNGTYKGWG